MCTDPPPTLYRFMRVVVEGVWWRGWRVLVSTLYRFMRVVVEGVWWVEGVSVDVVPLYESGGGGCMVEGWRVLVSTLYRFMRVVVEGVVDSGLRLLSGGGSKVLFWQWAVF
jgi:hypothetical protein